MLARYRGTFRKSTRSSRQMSIRFSLSPQYSSIVKAFSVSLLNKRTRFTCNPRSHEHRIGPNQRVYSIMTSASNPFVALRASIYAESKHSLWLCLTLELYLEVTVFACYKASRALATKVAMPVKIDCRYFYSARYCSTRAIVNFTEFLALPFSRETNHTGFVSHVCTSYERISMIGRERCDYRANGTNKRKSHLHGVSSLIMVTNIQASRFHCTLYCCIL